MYRVYLLVLLAFPCLLCAQSEPMERLSIQEVVDEWGRELDVPADYASVYEALEYLAINPINLNDLSLSDLNRLLFLSEDQVEAIIAYRREYGDLQSLYELQVIDEFDRKSIRWLLPFVEVKPVKSSIMTSVQEDFWRWRHLVLARSAIRLESKENNTPWGHLIKLRSATKTHFGAGLTVEKDAGEPYWEMKRGLAFYSVHVEARELGRIKRLVIGDFNYRFGQGLAVSSGFQLNKGTQVLQSPKFSEPVSRYGSTEGSFFRGIATNIQLTNYCEVSLWGSRGNEFGGDFRYQRDRWSVGLLATNSNYSSLYRWRLNKLLFYGEFAVDKFGNAALLSGLNIKLTSILQFSLLYRNYGSRYRAIHSAGFSEGTGVSNEEGFYLGFEFLPAASWKIACYVDRWVFPQPTYWVAYPRGKGSEFYTQVDFTPNSSNEFAFRFKREFKDKEGILMYSGANPEVLRIKQYVRFQYRFRLTEQVVLNTRLEWNHYSKQETNSQGYLMLQDLVFDLPNFHSKCYFRYAHFSAMHYENRFHVYENDLLYSFSTPTYYGIGARYYVLHKYELRDGLTFWVKWSQTFTDLKKSDLRIQVQWKFL